MQFRLVRLAITQGVNHRGEGSRLTRVLPLPRRTRRRAAIKIHFKDGIVRMMNRIKRVRAAISPRVLCALGVSAVKRQLTEQPCRSLVPARAGDVTDMAWVRGNIGAVVSYYL